LEGFAEIAESRQQTLKNLIEEIDQNRQFANLSSLIRLFVLEFYKEKVDRRTSEESAIRRSEASDRSSQDARSNLGKVME
jgi:predicted DNA-binding ribbon-helix-helix protein